MIDENITSVTFSANLLKLLLYKEKYNLKIKEWDEANTHFFPAGQIEKDIGLIEENIEILIPKCYEWLLKTHLTIADNQKDRQEKKEYEEKKKVEDETKRGKERGYPESIK